MLAKKYANRLKNLYGKGIKASTNEVMGSIPRKTWLSLAKSLRVAPNKLKEAIYRRIVLLPTKEYFILLKLHEFGGYPTAFYSNGVIFRGSGKLFKYNAEYGWAHEVVHLVDILTRGRKGTREREMVAEALGLFVEANSGIEGQRSAVKIAKMPYVGLYSSREYWAGINAGRKVFAQAFSIQQLAGKEAAVKFLQHFYIHGKVTTKTVEKVMRGVKA